MRRFKKQKDAVAYQKAALQAVQVGEFVPSSKETVKECAEAWYQRKYANRPWSTRVERRSLVYNYIIPSFGGLPVQYLSARGSRWKRRNGKMRSERPRCWSTVSCVR
jgi:hypothetical protein